VLGSPALDPEVSFERLYRRHRGDVYRFLLRDLGSPEDAEDITQTAFLNAYRALDRGERPERPHAWLLTIARNVSNRRYRTISRRPREVAFDPDLIQAAVDDDMPTAGEIRRALGGLPQRQQAALVLREVLGLSYEQVAEELDTSTSAVETLLFRARRAFRERLESRPVLGLIPAALMGRFGSFFRGQAAVKAAGAVSAAVLSTGVAVENGLLPGMAAAAPRSGAHASAVGATPQVADVERSSSGLVHASSPSAKPAAGHHTGKHKRKGHPGREPGAGGTSTSTSSSGSGTSGGSLPAVDPSTVVQQVEQTVSNVSGGSGVPVLPGVPDPPLPLPPPLLP